MAFGCVFVVGNVLLFVVVVCMVLLMVVVVVAVSCDNGQHSHGHL